ncbi:MAG: folylpolyglutamate synthase/dihydrofolate synthase family protein [Paludibacter sp.]
MNKETNNETNTNSDSPLGARGSFLGSSYSLSLQYLYERLPVFHQIGGAAYKPGLDNSIRLMNALDNPQQKYRTIHVAGTNGKGSVSHLLAAVLQQAGYKVGLYTSPHLVDFGERIRVDGQMIEQQYVIDFVDQHKELFNDIEPSFFEATMAMAFDYFSHCAVDVVIIEVGLGGRLDSTNIIQPELSVITNISFDHVGFLGDSLAKIAYEKAGIIKPNTPVVVGETLPETRTVFESKAKEENAPLIFAEERMEVKFNGYSYGKMLVETTDNLQYKIGLCGLYQLKNVATTFTAIEQLRSLKFDISDEAIRTGLEQVTEITGLQGRWQQLQSSPLVVCDTGHNVAGIQFVVEQIRSQQYKTLRIVIGMVNDKDVSAVLDLLPTDAVYYFTQANIARALPAVELLQKAQSFGLKGIAFSAVKEAVSVAINDAELNDFVFIGGSNFVVGEALANCTFE